MQDFTEIPESLTLVNSRLPLLNNDRTAMSQNSGTTFPTSNLELGMPCVRTDLNKFYILTELTPVWTLVFDLSLVPTSLSELIAKASTKQNTITGAASTVASTDLPSSKVMVTSSSGKIEASSNVSPQELDYLNGVSSSIQAQIDSKVSSSSPSFISATSNSVIADGVKTSWGNNYDFTISHDGSSTNFKLENDDLNILDGNALRFAFGRSSGDFWAAGNVTGFSDLSLKKDLEIIPNALSKVCQLNGYTFTRRDTGARQTGVVAQEVQVVLPEAVSKNKAGILGVSYGNMIGLLIEGIKELKEEVVSLKRQIK